MPLLLVNRVNIYKALYYLTSDITSLTVSSSTLPFFLLSATLAFFLFSSNWPGFLPLWPLPSKGNTSFWCLLQSLFFRRPSWWPILNLSLLYCYHVWYILHLVLVFFVCILLVFVCLYMEYVKLMMEGFLLFMFTTKRLYPVLRAFCNNW